MDIRAAWLISLILNQWPGSSHSRGLTPRPEYCWRINAAPYPPLRERTEKTQGKDRKGKERRGGEEERRGGRGRDDRTREEERRKEKR